MRDCVTKCALRVCVCVCVCVPLQIESEFPEILPIKESLIKYVFEPNAAKVSKPADGLTVL
jgi:hypothetical protein